MEESVPRSTRGSCVRGTISGGARGSVIRSSRFTDEETYQMNMHITIVFLGFVAFNLFAYSWLSPHWYMLGRRAYTKNPELRVLGLTQLLEEKQAVHMDFVIGNTPERKIYKLKDRRDMVCNADDEGFVNQQEPEDCDLDCQDMELLGTVRVLCDDRGRQLKPFPIPIVPAPRIRNFGPEPGSAYMHRHIEHIDELRWSADCSDLEESSGTKCPVGYKLCKKERLNLCVVNGKRHLMPACCMDPTQIGSTLFNVTEAPTYVHVFGWAQWQQKELRTSGNRSNWCSVRHFRCRTLTSFTENGRSCLMWITIAGCFLVTAQVLSLSRYKRSAISFIAALFAAASLIMFFAQWQYHEHTAEALRESMTPVDPWDRPHIHAVSNYDTESRTLFNVPNASAEWMYYHANARVDYLTEDKSNQKGFTLLWGAYLGIAGALVAMLASVASFEMMFALKGIHPTAMVVKICLAVLLFIPGKLKQLVDDNLAAYPVLWVYPWQKLYVKAFTCGSWKPFPLDEMWDYGLMLPVHVIRAVWDYVSCQDICSPQEKEVLHKKGITNDRVCSLLCSRRSYFVMMAGLGAISFIVNLSQVVTISDQLAQAKQATSRNDNYPRFRCDYNDGNCAADMPDPVTMGKYILDMIIRTSSTVWEGSQRVETTKALIEWLGGFVAISCAAGALANWTNFSVSRKFCLIGWIFSMLTPVITSAFSPNRRVDWPKVENQVMTVSGEIWEEAMYFISKQDCDQIVSYVEMSFDKSVSVCGWVDTLKFVMPTSVKNNCEWLVKESTDRRMETMAKSQELCDFVKAYAENGPVARRQCEEKVRKAMPQVIDILQILVGVQAGIKNVMKLMAAAMSMVPALMQGGLMMKNMVPRQTLPSILLTLPVVFTSLYWAQYQMYYQILSGNMFLVASLAMSFGPLVYPVYAQYFRIVQPMCDQQSITLTFRIWWYAALLALWLPYGLMAIYIIWFNNFEYERVYNETIGSMSFLTLLQMAVRVLSSYAYCLQAGMDWFVDEIVSHHTTLHAPVVLTATLSKEEAGSLQQILGSDLDLDSIDRGTYVCGGLGDATMLHPSEEGTWNEKAQIYTTSLAFKDFATLDAFAGHIKGDAALPRILARARRPWYRLLNDPPADAFTGADLLRGQAVSAGEVEDPMAVYAGTEAVGDAAYGAGAMDREGAGVPAGGEAAQPQGAEAEAAYAYAEGAQAEAVYAEGEYTETWDEQWEQADADQWGQNTAPGS